MKGRIPAPAKALTLLDVYPVGSVYISTSATNPGTLFGGTWEQLKDRFLLGAGDSYVAGSTGGSATHTLTQAQMPKITGQLTAGSGTAGASGSGYGAFRTATGVFSAKTEMQYGRPSDNTAIAWPNGASSYQVIQLNIGGGEAHNNMPPYLAVYMWKRTA